MADDDDQAPTREVLVTTPSLRGRLETDAQDTHRHPMRPWQQMTSAIAMAPEPAA